MARTASWLHQLLPGTAGPLSDGSSTAGRSLQGERYPESTVQICVGATAPEQLHAVDVPVAAEKE